MNELSLFSGAGGGLLATKYLLGWTCIGYVEIDNYCQQVLAQRIKDGFLDNAPIFTDIRTFIDSGCAEFYRGITDVITAGFPCQPWSAAKTVGESGETSTQNQWPTTLETIRLVRPKSILLENVPNILTHRYVLRIFGDLASIGYCVPWDCLSSAFCRAEHKRIRLWIATLADPKCYGLEKCMCELSSSIKFIEQTTALAPYCSGEIHEDGRFWPTEDGICGLVDETPYWVERLRAVGNMQDPAVVEIAWKVLTSNNLVRS